jgi:hypothetical protein
MKCGMNIYVDDHDEHFSVCQSPGTERYPLSKAEVLRRDNVLIPRFFASIHKFPSSHVLLNLNSLSAMCHSVSWRVLSDQGTALPYIISFAPVKINDQIFAISNMEMQYVI